jgi:serine/threonine-protein kinase
LLQKEFDVLTAPSGQQGLALVLQHSFDVVISDQRMPGMTGSEFLREVRKASPRALRILLTGYSDLQAILRSVNEGEVFRFINKPWNIAELPRIVGEAVAIAQAQPLPPAAVEKPETPGIASGFDPILLVDDDPTMADLLRQAVAADRRIFQATNLADAIELLNSENIGVIVSDTRVDHMDTTRLLKMLKLNHPHLVTVVFSDEKDAADLVALINQGQIYRFVPKPVKLGYLKIVIESAQAKHLQLKDNPDFAQRHAVERLGKEAETSLLRDIELAAGRDPRNAPRESAGISFLQRVSGGFLRLFRA